jgi:16S rRNA (guanine527-N7)-methyltransferase
VDAYLRALLEGGRAIGLSVSDELGDRMSKHWSIVKRWAKKMNLTAVLDDERAASIHGLDSLLFAELFTIDDSSRVADVGSGAGFPGVVLALARPKLRITLLEPQRKRASFLKVALTELGLGDVEVKELRLDPMAKGIEAPFVFEAIVSRATIPPLELARIAPPYLAENGRLILSSGQSAEAPEALEAASSRALRPAERRDLRLPTGDRRVLDVLVKSATS